MSQFETWLDNLSDKVQGLWERLYTEAVNRLEGEANTCRAWLKQLYDYAITHHIDIGQYYDSFVSIETNLSSIEREIAQRAEQAERNRRPWWIKARDAVLHAISIVADIIGLAPLGNFLRSTIQRLPGSQERKLLN